MEYRPLGSSGLMVPALSFGTATFGGGTDFFRAWGSTDTRDARRLVSICLDAGVNLFDTADAYSDGAAEQILGQAVAGHRHNVLISTKCALRTGPGANDVGSSRLHIIRACEASLSRLGTDYIDIYHLHAFDALTSTEETLRALDMLVSSGKVCYVACSNFSGWHLMKALAVSDRYGWVRYAAHQVYYSLVGREYEWELMPLAIDQRIGALVWGPLSYGRLTGKVRRNQPLPEASRFRQLTPLAPAVAGELLHKVVDALDELATQTGKTIAQIALNWLLRRPTVASVIIGARDEVQLCENLRAVDWSLDAEQVRKLDAASEPVRVYPYSHQVFSADRNPSPVKLHST